MNLRNFLKFVNISSTSFICYCLIIINLPSDSKYTFNFFARVNEIYRILFLLKPNTMNISCN